MTKHSRRWGLVRVRVSLVSLLVPVTNLDGASHLFTVSFPLTHPQPIQVPTTLASLSGGLLSFTILIVKVGTLRVSGLYLTLGTFSSAAPLTAALRLMVNVSAPIPKGCST